MLFNMLYILLVPLPCYNITCCSSNITVRTMLLQEDPSSAILK